MAGDPIRRYYDRTASYYDTTRLPLLIGRRAGVHALDLRKGHHVLELGAGTGYNAGSVVSAIGTGTFTLLDFSVNMLHRARRKRLSQSQQAKIRYVACDATRFCLRSQFDRILFSYSLSFMPDPLSVLRTARDHLAAEGHIVVVDFGPMSGWGPLGTAVQWFLDRHSVAPIYKDIHRFRAEAPDLTLAIDHLGYTFLAKIPS